MKIQRSTERSTGRSTDGPHGPRAPIPWRWRPQPGCLQDQGYLEQFHACERILGASMARNRQRYAGKHTTLAPERLRKRSQTQPPATPRPTRPNSLTCPPRSTDHQTRADVFTAVASGLNFGMPRIPSCVLGSRWMEFILPAGLERTTQGSMATTQHN